MKYFLEDAEAKSNLFPSTFEIPTKVERLAVRADDLVKCAFRWTDSSAPTERMWVLVTKVVSKGVFEGTLSNHPFSKVIELGDVVRFEAKHILQIYPRAN